MTTLLDKVKKLKNTLLGLEMELDILEADLFELTADLNHLIKAEESLVYNICFLKKDGIVVVASEYKKSVSELKTVRSKILKYQSLKSKVLNSMKYKIQSRNFYKDQFNMTYKQLEDDPIILVFKKKEGNGEG